MHSTQNLAHRMGRWSAMHPWRAIAGWAVLVAACLALGGALGTTQIDEVRSGDGDAGRAARMLDDAGLAGRAGSELVLVEAPGRALAAADVDAVLADVRAGVSSLPGVEGVGAPQRSADGAAAVIPIALAGSADDAATAVGPVIDAVSAVGAAHPALRIGQFGDASAGHAIDDRLAADFRKAEVLSVPLTLVILIVAFGALLAAGIPVLLGLTSVVAAIGLSALTSRLIPSSEAAPILMMLIGMAVGVDYSLFYLKREREERARGASPHAALEAAAATSGHAVLVSGLTVAASLAGLFFMRDEVSSSIAAGSILVVALAVLGSLTVLPALLALLGDRVHRSRLPILSRLRRDERDSRLWAFVIGHAMRRPALALVAGVGVLVALAVPALDLHTKVTGPADLSRDAFPVLRTYDRIQAAFPAEQPAATLAVRAADADAPAVRAAVAEVERLALAAHVIDAPTATTLSADGTVASVAVPLVGDGSGPTSRDALRTLRTSIVPAAFAGVPDAEVAVGGLTAQTVDESASFAQRAPVVFVAVLAMAFLLLLVTFRSIVVPITAILLNLLSVGAAYGVLALVFQRGLGEAIGLTPTDGIVVWLPMFLFVILFGLSMDYHVFILSRIREARLGGMSDAEAIEHGIRRSAGVVTAAAVVMVAVFAIFATLSLVDLQQFGVGLAAAILLDATLIRGIVLPSSMRLLGRWNWYLPARLAWLPGGAGAGAGAAAQPAQA